MRAFIEGIIKKYIKDSQYKKNVLVMITGRIIAQIVPILLTPLLTRIYSPSEFGLFGVYASIIGLVAMISNGRYSLSIILPKEDEKARKLLMLSSILTTFSSLLFVCLLLLFGQQVFDYLEIQVLSEYIVILFLSMLFVGLYEALYYYLLREKRYKILATNIIIQAFILLLSKILLGYLGYTEVGLIISYLVGYSFSYILLIVRAKIPVGMLIKELNIREYYELIKKYSKFPRFSLFADTLSILAHYSPNILLNKIFGAVSTGYYSMSEKVLGSPVWFVTSSVGDVFKQEASEQLRTKNSCSDIFIKTSKTLFLLGIGPFLFIAFVSPYIIPFVLGENWEPVGDIIRIFSLMYFLKFVVTPVSHIIYIVNKQKYNIFFQGLNLFSTIISFAIGVYFRDLYLCLISFSVLSSISYIILFLYSYKFAREARYEGN